MNAALCRKPEKVESNEWQEAFLELLPAIQRQLRRGFRDLKGEAKEEAIQDALVHCTISFANLYEKRGSQKVFATPLAQFAIRHVKSGRTSGTKLNVREPLSQYSQIRKQFRVERIDHYDHSVERWLPPLVEDPRISVPDQVALRIDVPNWLAGFKPRLQRIARDLALGFTTKEMAAKYQLSAGRISQLRRKFHESWLAFHEASTLMKRAEPCRNGCDPGGSI